MGKYALTFNDYSNEKSTMSVHVPDLTSGTFIAQTAKAEALRTAVLAVVKGEETKRELAAYVVRTAATIQTDKDIQVERKWLVSAIDTVTGLAVTFTIPTADSAFVSNNTDKMDLSVGEGAALVAAIDGYVLSAAGNSVMTKEIRMVGRNG